MPETQPPDDDLEARTLDERRRTIGRAGLIGGATLISRLLGLLRENIFARLFGAGLVADAFNIAYRIPNLLRDLFAEGALSSALVPTFVEVLEKDGKEAAFRLAGTVLSGLLMLLGLICLLGVLFAPQLVDLLGPGFGRNPDKRALTIELTRWLMPFILLMSWAAVWRTLLNVFHRYLVPALAPALFNLVAIATGYGLWLAGLEPLDAVLGWTWMTLAGGAVMIALQIVPLRRLGASLGLAWQFGHSAFRRVVRHMLPALFGVAAIQISIVVNSALASHTDGDVTCLNFAFRMVYLPIGVIGVAVATVSTVNVSAAAARGDPEAFRDHLTDAMRLVAFFTLPATAGLYVLADPVVRLVYQYGEMTVADAERTALALRWYALGLFFYSGVKVLAPSFYALQRVRVPALASALAVAANITWALTTYERWGIQSLALATVISALVNFLVLSFSLRRALIATLPRVARPILAMGVLAAACGATAWGLAALLEDTLGTAGVLSRALQVLIPIAGGFVVVIAGGLWLGLHEANDVMAALRRRTR